MAEDPQTFLTQGNEPGQPLSDDENLMGEDMHVSESTRLHKKMREMKLMDEKLAAMKHDYAQRIRIVKLGEARFLEKQRNTIEYLRKFKAFIIETDTKRMRADKKYNEEKRQIIQKEQEIQQLRKQLQEKRNERDKKLRNHERIKINQTYLDKVLAISEQYTEIDELLTRYKILNDTNVDLRAVASKVVKEQESYQAKIQTLLKNKQNAILVKNSDLARCLKTLEDVSNSTSNSENEAAAFELKTKEFNRKFGEIQMAIRNIHARTVNSYPKTIKKSITHTSVNTDEGKGAKEKNRKRRTKNNKDEEGYDSDAEARDQKNALLLATLIQYLDVVAEKVEDIIVVASVGKEHKSENRRGDA